MRPYVDVCELTQAPTRFTRRFLVKERTVVNTVNYMPIPCKGAYRSQHSELHADSL